MDILAEKQNIFFHGIAGAGMRGLAWLLAEQGRSIAGTDASEEALMQLPEQFDTVPESQASALLQQADLYIHSDAVVSSHPLRVEAQELSIPAVPYHKALGSFASKFETVAITGTHGKSSTTAFLAHILTKAGKDPSALIGAGMPTWPGKHARFGKSGIFVVEADEYRNHFHEIAAKHVIIPTLEYDHPDFFTSPQEVWDSFQTYIDKLPEDGFIIIPTTLAFAPITWPKRTLIIDTEKDLPVVTLPGRHMQQNAKLAIAAAAQLGVPEQEAIQHLTTFPGLSRRFERLGTLESMEVITDYAHHPTEVEAVLESARGVFGDKKILVVFEAHMAERMEAFNSTFAKALSLADGIVLYPPYLPAGRAGDKADVLRDELVHMLSKYNKPTTVLADTSELGQTLKEASQTYDAAIACTAGALDGELRKIIT